MPLPILALVVPCYNEEEIIAETIRKLLAVLENLIQAGQIAAESFLLFVDDGSRDATWAHLETSRAAAPAKINALRLTRNFGHQNALLAGLLAARKKADCLVSIDADLQDDTGCIASFIAHYKEGCDIVYGIRRKRTLDTWFKRNSARFFYTLMRWLGADVIHNHADYRLISRRVADTLEGFGEYNLFLRGIFPLMGYKTARVLYDRHPRLAGKTKYPFCKMMSFALNGITSFSVFPLRLISFLGITLFIGTLLMTADILFTTLVLGHTVPGWASTVLPIYFIGGIQLLCVGVLGEYMGKMYQEIKARPRFIVEQQLD